MPTEAPPRVTRRMWYDSSVIMTDGENNDILCSNVFFQRVILFPLSLYWFGIKGHRFLSRICFQMISCINDKRAVVSLVFWCLLLMSYVSQEIVFFWYTVFVNTVHVWREKLHYLYVVLWLWLQSNCFQHLVTIWEKNQQKILLYFYVKEFYFFNGW